MNDAVAPARVGLAAVQRPSQVLAQGQTQPQAEVCLREYQSVEADPQGPHRALLGCYTDEPAIAELLRSQCLRNKLHISENRHGLCVRADRWVGVVQLGPVRIRIKPKIPGGHLWPLLSYALGVDQIRRYSQVQLAPSGDFLDLVAQALWLESEQIWQNGLHRSYEERNQWLDSPRGRPDLARLAVSQPLTRAALPCHHHAFTTDVLANQVVLAGLLLARALTQSVPLRSGLHRAVERWRLSCTPVALNPRLMAELAQDRNRLTARYATAHDLVALLVSGTGLDAPMGDVQVPGFLWDMASTFERFVARFLSEHLQETQVSSQVGLAHLYRIQRGRPGLSAPRPRPDLVLRQGGRTVAVLDTKYTDLAKNQPSSGVIYQASVYSLAWSGTSHHDVPAILLYPQSEGRVPDVELSIHIAGAARPRRILLRAIDWMRASDWIWKKGALPPRIALAERWTALEAHR